MTTATISPTTERATIFVADHRAGAEELGAALAELTGEPAAFRDALRNGRAALSDPD